MERYLLARERLLKDLEREPLDEEMAAEMGIEVNVNKALRIKKCFKPLIVIMKGMSIEHI